MRTAVVAAAGSLLATLALAGPSAAQGTATTTTTTTTTAAATPAAARPAATTTRSASPARQAIARGHAAYAARNYDAALAAYREVGQIGPERGEAALCVGYVLQARNDADGALASFREAAQLAGAASDHGTYARAMQAIANGHESRGRWDDAATAWGEFVAFADAHRDVANAATGRARVEAIRARAALAEATAPVRARIEERTRANAQGPQGAARP